MTILVISQDLLLVKILKLVLTILPKVDLPKRRGRPYTYSPRVIVCCFLVMVAKKLSVRGLHALLISLECGEAEAIRKAVPFPQGKIPNRRTFDRRLTGGMGTFQQFMLSATQLMVRKFHLGVARLSLDNRMFEAFGKVWHRKHQEEGTLPGKLRGVDTSAGWGFSSYRRWVFGHALDVFVTTGKLVVPVLAFGRSLRSRGNTALKGIAPLLPKVRRGAVVADSEYYDFDLGYLLQIKGRRLDTPSKKHPEEVPRSKTYQKRKTTVEPFYERFLLAFLARGKLDRKGPQAWGCLVLCCLLYQLVVIYNLLHGKPNPLKVTHLIRIL